MAYNNGDEVFLEGKTMWFRHQAPNPWGKWAHVLYPVPASLEIIRDLQTSTEGVSGIKNELKKDDDGYFMTFSRPVDITRKDGTKVGLSPPLILDKDNQPYIGAVGNGSKVITKLKVRIHPTQSKGKARAVRWEGSRIEELVPFEKSNFPEDQAKVAEGLIGEKAPF